MLSGFEKYTDSLTDYEKEVLLPVFVQGLRTKIGKESAVTNAFMIKALKQQGYKHLSEPRVRKIINYIRCTGLIHNLVASSKGYWVENDLEERRKYVDMVKERAEAMLSALKYINF